MNVLQKLHGGGGTPSAVAVDQTSTVPPGWREVKSRSTGKSYFLHVATNTTQWDRPTSSEPVGAAGSSSAEKSPHESSKGGDSKSKETVSARLAASALNKANDMSSTFSSMLNSTKSTLTAKFASSTTAAAIVNNGFAAAAREAMGRDKTESAKQGQVVEEVFENQRLNGDLGVNDPKKYSTRDPIPCSGVDDFPEVEVPQGWEWTGEWSIDREYTSCDADGWSYGTDFQALVNLAADELSHASRHPNDNVRRRRWVRFRQPVGYQTIQTSTKAPIQQSAPVNQAPVYANDPFAKTQQRKQDTGFKALKFLPQGTKDATKEYGSFEFSQLYWLVTGKDASLTSKDDVATKDPNDMQEGIRKATADSEMREKKLAEQSEKSAKQLQYHRQRLRLLVAEFKRSEHTRKTLLADIAQANQAVKQLQEDVNEEQRSVNAELEAANHALENKAKSLQASRLRYQQDKLNLSQSLEYAAQRLAEAASAERGKASAQESPESARLRQGLARAAHLQTKLQEARQHRQRLEEERRDLLKELVESKATIKYQSKQQAEQARESIEQQISVLRQEQTRLVGELTRLKDASPEQKAALEQRRQEIRLEMSDLKQRRLVLQSGMAEPEMRNIQHLGQVGKQGSMSRSAIR